MDTQAVPLPTLGFLLDLGTLWWHLATSPWERRVTQPTVQSLLLWGPGPLACQHYRLPRPTAPPRPLGLRRGAFTTRHTLPTVVQSCTAPPATGFQNRCVCMWCACVCMCVCCACTPALSASQELALRGLLFINRRLRLSSNQQRQADNTFPPSPPRGADRRGPWVCLSHPNRSIPALVALGCPRSLEPPL